MIETISRVRQVSREQLRLFASERRLGTHGQVRYEVGTFVEELTCLFFPGAQRHRTDSNCDYCPDVSIRIGGFRVYFECKSVGKSREAFVYAGRLERDREFAESNFLYYCIWHHRASLNGLPSVEDLQRAFLLNLRSIYLVPFDVIDGLCAGREPMKLNSAYGRTSEYPERYGAGFRFPLSKISDFKLAECEIDSDFIFENLCK